MKKIILFIIIAIAGFTSCDKIGVRNFSLECDINQNYGDYTFKSKEKINPNQVRFTDYIDNFFFQNDFSCETYCKDYRFSSAIKRYEFGNGNYIDYSGFSFVNVAVREEYVYVSFQTRVMVNDSNIKDFDYDTYKYLLDKETEITSMIMHKFLDYLNDYKF